jgi:ATP-dependent RNA helicase RhlE
LADRHHHKKDREGAAAVRASQEARGPQEALAGEKNLAFDQLGLSREVLDAVAEMGHTQPTPVQAQAIPLVLAGRDVLAAAQTGTGKTEAFLLPTLSRLGHAGAGEGPLMLVITPTRELAQQIDDVARTICAHTGHRTVTLVGGVAYEPQYQALARGCDVLVATPGRLQDLLDSGHASLDHVGVLVLDEADRMLDMGFLPAVKKIVARTPSERQTLLFSATLDDDAIAITRSLVRDPAHVKIARKGTPAQTIEQFVLGVSPEAKNAVLAEVLRREGAERVIVFTRGKHRADAICRKLRKAGFACAPIHGNRTQRQRENALRSFREGAVERAGGDGRPCARHRHPGRALRGELRRARRRGGLHPPHWPHRARRRVRLGADLRDGGRLPGASRRGGAHGKGRARLPARRGHRPGRGAAAA